MNESETTYNAFPAILYEDTSIVVAGGMGVSFGAGAFAKVGHAGKRGETKNNDARSVPILNGDMRDALLNAKQEHDLNWPRSPWVFARAGERIRDFRWAWEEACKRAGVEGLTFHDLRRTAVRNMGHAGIPQVVRTKISGHKTDSMERRYDIVDADDLNIAKELMERRGGTRAMQEPSKARDARSPKEEKFVP